MRMIADDIRFWAGRKAKAEALPPRMQERYRETYEAVCARLKALTDAVFRDAIAVIDTSQNAHQVDAAAEVMQACIDGDALRVADAVAQYKYGPCRSALWRLARAISRQSGVPPKTKTCPHHEGKGTLCEGISRRRATGFRRNPGGRNMC